MNQPITREAISAMAAELREAVKNAKGSSQGTMPRQSDYESGTVRPETFRPRKIVYGRF